MKVIFVVTLAVTYVAYIYAVEAVECPPHNGIDVTLLPNPKNCKTYYLCNEGIPYLMDCPSGLHFNAKLRVCDLPNQANCTQSSIPTEDTIKNSTVEPPLDS